MILPEAIYRTKRELKASGTIHFNKPVSYGFYFDLPKGEYFKISVWVDPTENFIQVFLTNPKKYELKIVDNETINSPFYSSYSLTIERNVIEESCELISDFGNAIYFYSSLEKYGEFSNFSNFGFNYEGLYYSTVEHFFQSQKFIDKSYAELIRTSHTAKDASTLGRSRLYKIKEDWDEIKTDVMTLGVKKKFETHESLRQMLISTGDLLLIENSPYDNYWGIGSNGEGSNQLGTILMRIRELMKNVT